MGEKINKEFEKFQNDLIKREARIKFPIKFTPPSELDDIINDIKNKKLYENH